jgi:DNA polymerase phi
LSDSAAELKLTSKIRFGQALCPHTYLRNTTLIKMGSKRKRSAQDPSKVVPSASKRNKTSGNNVKNSASSPPPQGSSWFLNDPKGEDLKREVQLYDSLASEDTDERLKAANAIVSGLLGGEGVEEATLQRHLERRLFRGLASGRKGARLGFSVVLTEILAQLFGSGTFPEEKYIGLTFDKVLGFLIAKTKPDGDLSGQEEKDHFLGLLFGLQSLVRAKILFGDNKMWNAVLEKLLELANKKPWTREECGWVIVEALGQMSQSHAEYTLDKLYGAALAITPEGVGIWITAKNKFPDMKFPNKPWGQPGNPLDRLQSLAKALKESSSNGASPEEMQQVKQTGNWNAQLHFVWNIVLTQFADAQKIGKSGVTSDFANFWKVAVDGQYAFNF